MNKDVKLDDVIEIMLEKLAMGGTVTFTPGGESMLPMLRDGEDAVMLSMPRRNRLSLFDIPLYVRPDGSYVLHRIIDFDPDGSYVLCGDNQFVKEHGVTNKDIIGVVTAFTRKGKPYSVSSRRYRLYVLLWCHSRPLRRAFRAGKNALGIKSKKKKSEKE